MDVPSIISSAIGCVPLPGLKVAFDTFRWIWSSVVQAQSNKAQLIQLASAIAELLTTLQGNLHLSLTPEQGASLQRLQTLLDEISSFVSGLQQMHFLKALFRKDEISTSITAYHERIFHACDAFNISSQINLQVWLAQSESTRRTDYASLERLLQKMNHDQVAMFDFLNISDKKQDTLLTMMIAMQQAVNRISDNTERMFMQQAVRVIQRHSTSAQDVNDLPSWLVTSWEVDIERKKIGAGGFGNVYPAKWHGTKVAVKELDSQTSPELLKQEVDIWSKLLHPHVLQFLGAAIYESTPFLVMPLMTNGNCLDHIKNNTNVDRGLLVHQITLGLAYLHSRRPPVLHGDLKAVNVLVNASGDAILADFGLSRVNRDISTRSSSRVHTAGSLRWMAPERLREGRLTAATDVYAFALTVFEIYTEAVPFGDIDDSMLYTLVVKENERPHQHDEDAIPPYSIEDRAWVILTRAWDSDPRKRPVAVQLVDMTAPLVSERSRPAKSLPPPPPAESIPLSPTQPAEASHEATKTQKLPSWVEIASSPDVKVQLQACESLYAELQETPTIRLLAEALEQLIRLLMSSDPQVVNHAASVLGLYTHVPSREWFVRDRYQKGMYTEDHAKDCIAAGALLPFSAILQSTDEKNLGTACYVVGNLGFFPSSGDALLRARVIPRIIRLLKHSDSEVRRAAVQAIGKISANNRDYQAECIGAGALPFLYTLLVSSDLDCVHDVCAELPHLVNGFQEDIKKAGFHTRVITLFNHQRPKLCIAATFCLVNIILYYHGKPYETPNEYTKATMRLCLKNNLLPQLLAQLSYPDREVVLYTCHCVLDLTYGFVDEFIKAKIHEKMVRLASGNDYDIQSAAQHSLIRFCSQSSWLSKRALKKAGTIEVLKNLALRDVYAQVAINSLSSILL